MSGSDHTGNPEAEAREYGQNAGDSAHV
jgi:hypothetical protein